MDKMEQSQGRGYESRRGNSKRRRGGWQLPGILALWAVSLYLICGQEAVASTTQPTFSRQETTASEASDWKPLGQNPGAPESTIPIRTAEDAQPPVIAGALDRTVYAGDTVTYYLGVTVTDDTDPQPELTVDSAAVDLMQPGVYFVTYTATDASGNTASKAATVTVLSREAEETIRQKAIAAADEVLKQIITPDMTPRDQVWAVYNWAKSTISYTAQGAYGSWEEAAYAGMTGKQGDCFVYYAATKLLFQRLELPTIDVRKVPNNAEDSEHYWSLVSVDGGKTYYHFDATPRSGQSQQLCLVTDAFLGAFSRENNGSHNRDTSLYPPTPEV